MEKPVHPWATSVKEAKILGIEEIKAKFRPPDNDTDQRIKQKVEGAKTRDKLSDPTKPQFERDDRHIKELDRYQKSKLFNVTTKERADREKINLKPFDVTLIKTDFTCVYFGKRREGKSFAMRWHLFCMRDQLPRGYIFTATKINGFWQQYCPEKYIFDGYSPGILYNIITEQKKLINYLREHPDEVINPNLFIVLDDCVTEDLYCRT